MSKLKMFTEQGINAFKEYLIQLKTNPSLQCPSLEDSVYCDLYSSDVEIDSQKIFSSRMELAQYLTKIFNDAGIKKQEIINIPNIWSWLTYLWFDQICPQINNIRNVRRLEYYICEPHAFRYYRHYIAASYILYNTLDEKYVVIFLNRALNEHGEFIEQLASRQEIISQQNLIEVIYLLFWDELNCKSKKGVHNYKKPGSLRRLPKIFEQFQLTYDIFSMRSQEILNLLPKEFNGWKN